MSLQESVKDQIYAKLNALTGTGKKLAVVYDEYRENPAEYPCAMFEQTGEVVTFLTTMENLHKWTWRIYLCCDSQATQGKDKAIEIAAELEKQNTRWITYGLAEIYSVMGDNDRAIYWLEEAYRQRHDFVPWIRVNPHFGNLHNDTRFKDIINRLNLPD